MSRRRSAASSTPPSLDEALPIALWAPGRTGPIDPSDARPLTLGLRQRNIPSRSDLRGHPMRQIAEEKRLPANIDAQPPVQAAAALRSVIRGYREEI